MPKVIQNNEPAILQKYLELISCIWLSIHEYIYLIQSIHMGVSDHFTTLRSKGLNLQIFKAELTYDAHFFCVSLHL